MAKTIQAIRGMNDCLPVETPLWQWVEDKVRNTMSSYGYNEIRMPIVEKTPLFARAIGEVTDVVEKEMFTFEDRMGKAYLYVQKERQVVFGQVLNMVYFIIKNNAYGTWDRCFVMNAHKKVVIVNFTKLAWKFLVFQMRKLMLNLFY